MFRKLGLLTVTAALAVGATAAVAQDKPKRGGSMVIISSQVPRHFNPAVQSGIATMAPGAQIFATLTRADANWKIHPYLATSWKVSDGGKAVTCLKPVRPGVPITGRTHLHEIYDKSGRSGRMIFIVTRMEIFDAAGEHLASSDSRMVIRERSDS